MNPQKIISTTQQWLTSYVIAYNICPFARRVHETHAIHYRVCEQADLEQALQSLMEECFELEANPEIATSLVIYPLGFDDFEDYLDLLEIAERLLSDRGYDGIFQLASFHPNYCFDDSEQQDPANYTNRSPYPMLHVIREDSLSQALASYPEPEKIPERNIQLNRELGLEVLRRLLADCHSQANASND